MKEKFPENAERTVVDITAPRYVIFGLTAADLEKYAAELALTCSYHEARLAARLRDAYNDSETVSLFGVIGELESCGATVNIFAEERPLSPYVYGEDAEL